MRFEKFLEVHSLLSRPTKGRTLRAKRSVILNSIEVFFNRRRNTTPVVLLEGRMDDDRTVDGDRMLSGSWTNFYPEFTV